MYDVYNSSMMVTCCIVQNIARLWVTFLSSFSISSQNGLRLTLEPTGKCKKTRNRQTNGRHTNKMKKKTGRFCPEISSYICINLRKYGFSVYWWNSSIGSRAFRRSVSRYKTKHERYDNWSLTNNLKPFYRENWKYVRGSDYFCPKFFW